MQIESLREQAELNALQRCRILIIEDNSYVREAFQLTLLKTGLNALVLTTAEEALQAVKRGYYHVIICDYRLPGMDGLEFFTCANALTKKSTKVLISAYGFEDAVTACAESIGVDHYFVKPFSIHQLLMKLNLSRTIAVNE